MRAFRLRTGAGLSAGTQSAALAMGCIWLGYYMHAGLHLAVVTGSASLVMYLTLTFLAWRSGGERDTPWALLLALATILVLGAAFGARGVALGLGLSPLVVEAPQVFSLLRRDAVVLSRAAYLFALLEAAAWLPYAFLRRDLAIGLWGASACVSCATVLLLLARRRRDPGLRAAGDAAAPGTAPASGAGTGASGWSSRG